MKPNEKIFKFFEIFVPKPLKPLYEKIGVEMITYLFVGVITTLISWLSFWAGEVILGEGYSLISNVISFACAIAFAYPASRNLVFESKTQGFSAIFKEFIYFVGMRLASFGFEELCLWVFVDMLSVNSLLVKVVASVVVVILNYFFSKLVIFKKK